MKRRLLFRLALAAVLAGFCFFLLANTHSRPSHPKNTESLEESCCRPTGSSEKAIWEALPHQFFSSIGL